MRRQRPLPCALALPVPPLLPPPQLWRVLERSDVVIQIVDCRNPDLYRCVDMERYVHEISPHKRLLMVLNKADFLPPSLRVRWARWLMQEGVEFVFFSAKLEQAKVCPLCAAHRSQAPHHASGGPSSACFVTLRIAGAVSRHKQSGC